MFRAVDFFEGKMEVYIVRHGKTYWNDQGLLQGTTDIELNAEGRQAAGDLGRQLEDTEIDLIFSSPLIRAYETACLIRGHRNIQIKRDERLKEISFGLEEGKSYHAFKDAGSPYEAFFNAPQNYLPPEGGETFLHVIERTKNFLKEEIEPLYKNTNRLLIVGHGALNKGLMFTIKNNSMENYWAPGLQKNCQASIFNFDGQKWSVVKE